MSMKLLERKFKFLAGKAKKSIHVLESEKPLLDKGLLISKCIFEKIVWTKIPTKNLIDSAQQV